MMGKAWENEIQQVKGLSPECILVCSVRWLFVEKDFEQTLQAKGFLPNICKGKE